MNSFDKVQIMMINLKMMILLITFLISGVWRPFPNKLIKILLKSYLMMLYQVD
jgi:hypothetical protein